MSLIWSLQDFSNFSGRKANLPRNDHSNPKRTNLATLPQPMETKPPSEARLRCHEILVEWFLPCEGFALDTLPQLRSFRSDSVVHSPPTNFSAKKDMIPQTFILLKVSPIDFVSPTWKYFLKWILIGPNIALHTKTWPFSSFFVGLDSMASPNKWDQESTQTSPFIGESLGIAAKANLKKERKNGWNHPCWHAVGW